MKSRQITLVLLIIILTIVNGSNLSLKSKLLSSVAWKPILESWGTLRIRSSGKCVKGSTDTISMESCNEKDQSQHFKLVQNGQFYRILAKDGKVIDNKFGKSDNGNTYWNFPVNWSYAQNWKFEHKRGGYFLIKNQNNNKCLDGPWGSTLHQWDCHGLRHQQFRFYPIGHSLKRSNKSPRNNQIINLKRFYQIKSLKNKCIREQGKHLNVIVSRCTKFNDGFFFKFEKQVDGSYVIKSETGHVFQENNHKVISNHVGKAPNQRWILEKNGGNYRIKTLSGKCLDSEKFNTHLDDCNENILTQVFSFIPYKKVFLPK